jgi:D-alanine-D-alanine ligase
VGPLNSETSVAVVAGGLSFEREISLRSGRRVAEALRDRGYWVTEFDAGEELLRSLSPERFSVAFLAVHGRLGEDGTLPVLLELIGIPYTGSGFDASRLAFDKLASKSTLRRAGIPVPDAVPLTESALRDLHAGTLIDRVVDTLGGFPLVVKPNHGGSALGVRLVQGRDELNSALLAAFSYDDTVLVERRVVGTEIAVTVVDGMAPLPLVEVHTPRQWFDYAAHYSHGGAKFVAPAELDRPDTVSCLQIAATAHRALGCRDISRVDAVLDEEGTCWVLEVSPSPGLTETGVVSATIEAAGLTLGDLATHLLDRALGRNPR